jgi:hypothetical protein
MADLLLERTSRNPRTYELRDGGVPIGVLRYPRRMSQAAEAESPEGGWQMPSIGAFRSETAVLSPGGASEIGWVYRRRWRGGADLELFGRALTLRKVSWWRSSWVLAEGDAELVYAGSRVMSSREPLTLETRAAVPAPIVLMACHLVMVTIREESAAAGASAAAVGATS